ncbi:MAG TPA: hypothetical protein PLL26_05935 [Candidatus Dojkabacteria bacterium]|nr:hypothetical protein [Candidatus Dojkabacteria bacterium]
MSKNITITSIDGVDMGDKHNMGSETPPRKKIKMLHEQLFEQYGIDPNKVYERTGLLKTLLPDWIPDIIIGNINSCKTPRTYQNVNLNDRTISLGFENPETCENFYKEFNTNMSKSINNFLDAKKEDPRKYNRIIVVESSVDNIQITIRY